MPCMFGLGMKAVVLNRSHMWEQLDKGTKERLLKQKEDGEFWMSWEDFRKCFTFCYVQVHDAETKYTHSGKRQPQGETKYALGIIGFSKHHCHH